jgi:hypothetical protein
MSIEFFLLRVLICGHVRKGGWRKKHWELGETTLGELFPKAWRYIHKNTYILHGLNSFFFLFLGGFDHWALPRI